MRRLHYAVLGVLLCPALAAADPSGKGAATPRAPFTSGMIERDPSAVESGTPPAEVVPPRAAPAPVEIRGMTPGGGWKVHGPFVHTMHATTSEDGKVTTECVPGRAGE